jgi:hypothetical protein
MIATDQKTLTVVWTTFPFRQNDGEKERPGLRIPHDGDGLLLAYGSSQRIPDGSGLHTLVLRDEITLARAGLVKPTRFELDEVFLFAPGAISYVNRGVILTDHFKPQLQWLHRSEARILGNATRVAKIKE